MRSYEHSQAWYERAKQVTPNASQTNSKSPGRVGPLGAYPLGAGRAKGCYVWEVDKWWDQDWCAATPAHGPYVDWYCGNCAVTLGHQHERIVESVKDQLSLGILLPLPSPLEAKVAEWLCQVIPCAESVRFLKTGSESTEAAIRIARAATGRDVIVITDASYHGWHSWYAVTKDRHPGVPEFYAEGVRVVPHGDQMAMMDALRDDVAMVFIEPQFHRPHETDYLRDVQVLARGHDVLFGLDEIVAGGRLALGGAQEAYGLDPDLATFGKSFGQGLPMAFVCGRQALMQHATLVSGTFGGELLSLAACRAMLRVYAENGVIARIHTVGQMLMDGFNGTATRLNVPVRLTGHPSRPWTVWTHDDINLCQSLFQQELAERGVITHYTAWNPSAAHTAEAIADTLTAARGALEAMVVCLASDNPAQFLRGERIADSIRASS